MQFGDRSYSTRIGSDIDREGMYLELEDVTGGGRETVAEWFYSDVDGAMEFTAYQDGISDAVLTWFHAEAVRRLPPRPDAV